MMIFCARSLRGAAYQGVVPSLCPYSLMHQTFPSATETTLGCV